MKSSKQRRKEITETRKQKREAENTRLEKLQAEKAEKRKAAELADKEREREALIAAGKVMVNHSRLNHSPTIASTDFEIRGYYEDIPFTCRGCRKKEVWTATQQKWWYEVAGGETFTTASRCRTCRRKEKERKAEHRRKSQEGMAKKLLRKKK